MSPRDLVAPCAVALGVLVLAGPVALERLLYQPDAIGYVGVANNWIHGRGFVDAVSFSYYLPDGQPPTPAFAIRAPAISLLAAVPLAFGGDLETVVLWHVIFSALVAGGAVLVARRALSLPAAIGFGIAVGWAPGYLFVARQPLTEVTAVAALLAVIAAAGPCLRSIPGAIALAALSLVAWTARPNLGLLVPLIAVAVAILQGPRAALRHRPLLAYVAAFAALHRAVVIAVEQTTGFAPYAHYGMNAQITSIDEIYLYQRTYPGFLPFLQERFRDVADVIAANGRAAAETVFARSWYFGIGWFALPAALSLARRGVRSLEVGIAAVGGIAFLALAIGVYGGFAANRYLLLGIVCTWFVVLAAADGEMTALRARLAGTSRWSSWSEGARWLPTLILLAVFAGTSGTTVFADVASAASTYRQRGSRLVIYQPTLKEFCTALHPDARVASPKPFNVYFWCGNASMRIPTDLESVTVLNRYIDAEQPAYLIVERDSDALFERSQRLVQRLHIGAFALYEVIDPRMDGHPWRAPEPLSALLPHPVPRASRAGRAGSQRGRDLPASTIYASAEIW